MEMIGRTRGKTKGVGNLQNAAKLLNWEVSTNSNDGCYEGDGRLQAGPYIKNPRHVCV